MNKTPSQGVAKTGKVLKRGKSKYKNQGNPLQIEEERLISVVSKLNELYQMVAEARNCSSCKEFFRSFSTRSEDMQKMTPKSD